MNNPMTLWKTNRYPMRDLVQLQRAMDRWFDEVPGDWKAADKTLASFNPACEVTEDKTHYFFKFDLPGLSKDQVRVEIHDNELTVRGERKEEKREDTKKEHLSELSYGSFMRSFTFPAPIDMEKVEAKFENGVLNLAVAKTETAKSRQVNIK